MGELLLAFVVLCLTVGVLAGWAVRTDRRRRRAAEATLSKIEEVA